MKVIGQGSSPVGEWAATVVGIDSRKLFITVENAGS